MTKKYETGYIKSITDQEFEQIISALKPNDLKYRLIFFIGYYMGLRLGEICRLKYSSIKGDILTVELEKTREIAKRVIPEKVKRLLETYIFIYRRFQSGDYIFESIRKTKSVKLPHIAPVSVQYKLHKIRASLNLKDIYYVQKNGRPLNRISFHTFRHAFITRIYNQTKDLITTQRIIHHKKTETTARYIFMENILDRERDLVNL